MNVALVGLSLLFIAPAWADRAENTEQLGEIEEIVFAVRQPKGPHWYENMGYTIIDVNDKSYGSRGYSRHILYNLSRPEKSLLLLAPLAQDAGGYGLCGSVFTSSDDADFVALLAAINDAKAYLEKIRRFNMPHFQPEPEYVREMKRYGVLAPDHRPGDPIDVYDTDRKYWQSMWHPSAPARRVGRTPEKKNRLGSP